MKTPNIELAKAMLIASHDYGYYRMNNTVMKWLEKKDAILHKNNGNAIFADAENISKQSYYANIVKMAEARPLQRIN